MAFKKPFNKKVRMHKKRVKAYNIKKIVKKEIQRIRPQEVKYIDVMKSIDWLTATSYQYQAMPLLAGGIGASEREGDKVFIKGLTMGLAFRNYQQPGGAEGDYALDTTLRQTKRVFWALILDKNPEGASFDYTQVYEDVVRVPRFRVKEYQHRYQVLKQGDLVLDPDSGRDWIEKTMYYGFKKPLCVQYATATTSASEGNIVKNKLIFFAYKYSLTTGADENEVLGLDFRARVKYTE